jgi:hypothetical protein
MTASPAGHIPVFSAPTFKSFDPEDALMVDVIMPDHRAGAHSERRGTSACRI